MTQPWTPPSAPPEAPTRPVAGAPARRRLVRFLPTVASVAVVGGVAAGQLTGWFGADAAAPEVGDCVHLAGGTSFEVVECGGGDADYTVVGREAEPMTYDDAITDVGTCAAFATAEFVLWSGEDGELGAVYCAAPV